MEILFISTIAGLLQGLTGFGAGIILMLYLPYLYPVIQCSGIIGIICLFLSLIMTLQYRKFIELKKVLIPLSIYILISTITIVIGPSLNSSYLKKGLSLFFILLSFYFLFIKKKNTQIKMSIFISLFCILISSICDGLFGIGGPLMVIYFKNKTDNQNEYLGCIQLFFLVNCIYNTILRIINDILLPQHLSIILISIPAICLGLLIAKKISYQLNINFINKITYLIIGLSGLFNLIA